MYHREKQSKEKQGTCCTLEQINNGLSLTLKPGWMYAAVQVAVLYFTCGGRFYKMLKPPEMFGLFMAVMIR